MIKFLCESRLLGKESETERLEILKQILPDPYKYLVSEFSIKERSQIVGETTNVIFRVNITNKADIQVFFQNLGEKSGTTYNTFCGDTSGTGKKVIRRPKKNMSLSSFFSEQLTRAGGFFLLFFISSTLYQS